MVSPTLIGIFVVGLGLIIGSFLNVCIVRIPERKSIIWPASACPRCGAPIRPYDNIPVLSYVLLGGKCRACKAGISAMYPVVELCTAALFWACYRIFGLNAQSSKWTLFSALMMVLVATDLRERILPDVVNYTGLAAGLVFSVFVPPPDGSAFWIASRLFGHFLSPRTAGFADALLGAALGGGLLWLVSEAYFRLRKREGMGLGDVKMMLLVGAFLGVKRTMLTILVGSLLGSILGATFILARRKDAQYELPFGTFLGVAAVFVVFFGTPLLEWYQSLFRIP